MPSAAEFRSIQSFSFPKECRACEVYSTEVEDGGVLFLAYVIIPTPSPLRVLPLIQEGELFYSSSWIRGHCVISNVCDDGSFSFPKECRACEVYSTKLKTEEFETLLFIC